MHIQEINIYKAIINVRVEIIGRLSLSQLRPHAGKLVYVKVRISFCGNLGSLRVWLDIVDKGEYK